MCTFKIPENHEICTKKKTDGGNYHSNSQAKWKKPWKLKEGTVATRKRSVNTTQTKHVSMEKKTYDSTTNAKVSKYLPHNISFKILSEIPPKSLNLFRCIRNS